MTNEERLLRQIARDLHRLTVKLVGEEPKRESAASVSSLLRIGPKGPGAVMIESGAWPTYRHNSKL